MGEVYLAIDEWMEREVAIKLIQRKYADLPDFVDRFRRETKALAKLEHPNIVRIYSAGKAPDGRLYMIMERLRGLSLRKLIDTARRLDAASAVHYGLQIAEAVGIAHARGILHRDIKPENIRPLPRCRPGRRRRSPRRGRCTLPGLWKAKDDFSNAAVWSFVGAGVLGVGTVVYALVGPKKEATGRMQVSPVVTASGGGVWLHGAW